MDIVDPRVRTAKCGIRYRWIFLAKSHVKKKHGASSPEANSAPAIAGAVGIAAAAAGATNCADDNFGCVFCCLEDKVSGVYGGVETLMNHIALVHVADMSEQVQRKTKCILGRVAKSDEEFDINFPHFGYI